MDPEHKELLTNLKIEAGSAEQMIVQAWHGLDNLFPILNELPSGPTALIREALIESKMKASEAMQALNPVNDMLGMIVPFELPKGDADGVQ